MSINIYAYSNLYMFYGYQNRNNQFCLLCAFICRLSSHNFKTTLLDRFSLLLWAKSMFVSTDVPRCDKVDPGAGHARKG